MPRLSCLLGWKLYDKMEAPESLTLGAFLLRGFALRDEQALLIALNEVTTGAPFRNMVTPGGFRMSVAMTNCGELGWITDRQGYRYSSIDPVSGKKWPTLPSPFLRLAQSASMAARFNDFLPDACLINRYEPGAKMSLHQDKDERALDQPIVSVSLGLSATFLFGGLKRSDKTIKVPLDHGDVVVWGGPARMFYHGIAPLKQGTHAALGSQRINLTFRKAG